MEGGGEGEEENAEPVLFIHVGCIEVCSGCVCLCVCVQ